MKTIFTPKYVLPLFSFFLLTSLTGCQKEDLFEDQFSNAEYETDAQNGQIIPGQYIVVLKTDQSLKVNATGYLSKNGLSAISRQRESMLDEAGVSKGSVIQNLEGHINGFAAHLSDVQLQKLKRNPGVAYIERDRHINLIKDRFVRQRNRRSIPVALPIPDKNPAIAPSPEPTPEPALNPEPETQVPAPLPTPDPKRNPVVEPLPSYARTTPLAGEIVSWSAARVGFGDGTGKTVWIIDSGVDTDHPDLTIDLTRSKSFIYGVSSVEDGYGHGTAVAGIIAAKNNGSGMIGIASGATVVALRVFDDAGKGSLSRALQAVNYVFKNAVAGDVVNMSLGSGISVSLDNTIASAASKGILFAVAAGNTPVDCVNSSPARLDANGVYTISASDSYDRLWASSSYGLAVDYAAPGVNITSTTKGGGISHGHTGTSFAAPQVAGILLMRGMVFNRGTVMEDKDTKPDPLASIE